MYLHFLQTNQQKEAFIELAHRFANIDGNINKKEHNLLRNYLFELDMIPSDVVFASERDLEDIVSDITDESIRTIFLIELLMLVNTDGDYNDEERHVALQLQQLFDISDDKLKACMAWIKRYDALKIDGVKLILPQ